MRKLFTVQLAVIFQLAQLPAVHAGNPDAWLTSEQTISRNAVSKLGTMFNKKMKMSEFIGNLSATTVPTLIEFSKNKMNEMSAANETIELQQVSGTKIKVSVGEKAFTFEALNAITGDYKINDKRVSLDFSTKSYDAVLKQITDVLEKRAKAQKTSLLFELMMSEAQAEISWGWALAGLAAVGLGGYLWNNSNCNKYENFANSCYNGSYSGHNPFGFVNRVDDLNSFWSGPAFGCGDDYDAANFCMKNTKLLLNQGYQQSQAVVYPVQQQQYRTYQAPAAEHYQPVTRQPVTGQR